MIKKLKTIEQLKRENTDYWIDSMGCLHFRGLNFCIPDDKSTVFGTIVTIKSKSVDGNERTVYRIEEKYGHYYDNWFEEIMEDFLTEEDFEI